MKKSLLLLLICFVSSSLFAQDTRLPNGVEFETSVISRTLQGCDTSSGNCPNITISYDRMISGNNMDMYNEMAIKTLEEVYKPENASYTSLEQMADGFISDYSSYRKEYPETPPIEWYMDAAYRNVNELSRVLSFELSWESFTGGAHPNNYQHYYNYDYNTGKAISLSQLFISGYEAKLNELIVKAFREENNLGPNEPLTEGGLFDETITFNDNFLLTRDGIVFHYNIYEVRAYVYGPMDLTIKYSDLIDLIDENGLGIY